MWKKMIDMQSSLASSKGRRSSHGMKAAVAFLRSLSQLDGVLHGPGLRCGSCQACADEEEFVEDITLGCVAKDLVCNICGRVIAQQEHADHVSAHHVHTADLEVQLWNASSPEAIAFQIVRIAREACTDLEGMTWLGDVGDASNFDVAVSFMQLANALASQRQSLAEVERVYHWTQRENAILIIESGLRVPGEVTSDGTRVEVRHRESYGRGIYAATRLKYGQHYGGDRPCTFLCLALSGRVQQVSSRSIRIARADESFAGSVRRGPLRMYRRSDQLLPLFITDEAHNAQLMAVLQHIAGLVTRRLHSVPLVPAVFPKPSEGRENACQAYLLPASTT